MWRPLPDAVELADRTPAGRDGHRIENFVVRKIGIAANEDPTDRPLASARTLYLYSLPVLHMPPPPPPPPPPQRCCCSKNTLALKGSAPAGVATPMRTDNVITANTATFMAVSPRTKDIAPTLPKGAEGNANPTDIGVVAYGPLSKINLHSRLT
jgi:hypothetical protein